MKLTFKLLASSLLLNLSLQAQMIEVPIKKTCGTPVPSEAWDKAFNQKVEEHRQNRSLEKSSSTTYVIPVVVHVIHGGQAVGTYPNITQAQINSQISVLNDDFAGIGFNSGNLANTGFASIGAANCNISFCLAQFDQDGNPLVEPGIDRISYVAKSWTNPASLTSANFQNYVNGTIKPNSIWDPSRFFNIWITDHGPNVDLLGYATFPALTGTTMVGNFSGGNASTDGIWVWSKSFGSVGNPGSLAAPYNRGRTATHEAGHWLGVRHIGGDAGTPSCNATDYCADTPPQKGGFAGGQFGQNFGAPTYPLNVNDCNPPFGDMFMNFMDYTDDAINYMFTPDQSARMTTAMTYGTYRKFLTASSATACNAPVATMPAANFTFPETACVDSMVTTSNLTTGSPAPTYSWSVNPQLGVSFLPNSSALTPNVNFGGLGTFTVTMFATNSVGTSSLSRVVTILDCFTTGIKSSSLLQKNIILSPNPSSGVVHITSLSGAQNLNVLVHNYLGQLMTSTSFNNEMGSLDMSDYADGVYFVTIGNGQESTVKRLILSK